MNQFVAINYINCTEEYVKRFEELFANRAHAIDVMPGFVNMHVLRPQSGQDAYLIVSYWESETAFKDWTRSEAFIKGHQRGFKDVAEARAAGKPAPMTSEMKTYQVISQ